MSINIALSGLSAAQKDLNTTSNNIANANTVGFKESRAEFSDVYSNSIFSNANTTTGNGVQTATVAQQFHEGSSVYTNNPLDLRVSGSGFFALSEEGNVGNQNTMSLTRNGAFHLNKNNEVVNGEGLFLLGYQVNDITNDIVSQQPQKLKIDEQYGAPVASRNMNLGVNLPNSAVAPNNTPFDHLQNDTYNKSTATTMYDSLGSPHTLTTYYVKDAVPNAWSAYYTITDSAGVEQSLNVAAQPATPAGVHNGHTLNFDASGQLVANQNIVMEDFQTAGINMGGADPAQALTMNFSMNNANGRSATTQYAAPFDVREFEDMDGATSGHLIKVDVDPDGNVMASYSNGKDRTVGRIAMARVANEQGLAQLGGTLWTQTQESGALNLGDASEQEFGAIKSGTLEQSNIDMTQELVDLISAQRNFQASSRALDVNNQLQQNILQIR